jgi:hypothetical protein
MAYFLTTMQLEADGVPADISIEALAKCHSLSS